jgi:Zn-dependent protease
MIGDYIANAALYAVPLLLGVITHEVAHGWVAEKLGDPTARLMGRITLNPLVHIDPIGTVLLPLTLLLVNSPFLFGWAKPVPVLFSNLRGGRRDMALVALSGPLTNFLMAAASALVYHLILTGFQQGWIPEQSGLNRILEPVFLMARISVTFNLVLTVINLLPVPPLDGGRIMMGLLPYSWASRLEKLETYGMLIVLLLIGTGLWGYIVQPILSVFLRLFLG